MSCEFEQELTAYADGELDEVTRRKLQAHLPGCATCPPMLATLQRAAKAFVRAPGFEPSPNLRRAVMAQIDVPTFGDRLRSLWRPRVLVPAGALIAAGIAGLVALQPPKDPELPTDLQDPAQLEIAQNLEVLDDYDVVGLDDPDDLDVIEHLNELEATP